MGSGVFGGSGFSMCSELSTAKDSRPLFSRAPNKMLPYRLRTEAFSPCHAAARDRVAKIARKLGPARGHLRRPALRLPAISRIGPYFRPGFSRNLQFTKWR